MIIPHTQSQTVRVKFSTPSNTKLTGFSVLHDRYWSCIQHICTFLTHIVFYEAFGAEVTKIRANDDLSLTSLTKMTVSVHQTV